MEAEGPETIPDTTEPIIAARSWNMAGTKLFSLNSGNWAPGRKEARCEGRLGLGFGYGFLSSGAFMFSTFQQPQGYTYQTTQANLAGVVAYAIPQAFRPGYDWRVLPIPVSAIDLSTLVPPPKPPEPPPPHIAPMEHCTCGIYAVTQEDSDALWHGPVKGTVRLSGKIICGTKGWRAQYAEIDSLLQPRAKKSRALVSKVAEVYEVPVVKDWPELTPPWPLGQVRE